jgi:N-acetylneuraminic acid mutarotase
MAFGGNVETVVFRYPARYDTFHQQTAAAALDTIVQGCLFAPGATDENDSQAHQVVADATLYAPEDAPVLTARDQVMVRGQTYEVIGFPKLWFGEGYEIRLKLITG